MIKGSKEDSKSMLVPSTDRTSQKSNLRNAKSMMMTYDTPDTASADLITRDDGFNLGLGRETVRNGHAMNLSEGEIVPGAIDGQSQGRSAGIRKKNMKGKSAGKKGGADANSCNSCEQVCTIF